MSKKRGKQHTKAWKERRRQSPDPKKPAPEASSSATVTVTARSVESLALEEPLRFPVPSTATAFPPPVADYWWRLIEYGTDVPDPTLFPAIGAAFSHDERRVLERFVDTAQHLAASAALNHEISLKVQLGDGGAPNEVTSTDPPRDAVAGLSVLLRQCYADDEKASFKRVADILWRVTVREGGSDEVVRRDLLSRWRDAIRGTQARSIQNQVVQGLIRRGAIPPDPDLEHYPDSATPERLLSDYFYGDTIHWGRKAAALEDRKQDPLMDAFYRHDFFNAAACFAHLYIGYAALVESALKVE